jgi:hypothetical protein
MTNGWRERRRSDKIWRSRTRIQQLSAWNAVRHPKKPWPQVPRTSIQRSPFAACLTRQLGARRMSSCQAIILQVGLHRSQKHWRPKDAEGDTRQRSEESETSPLALASTSVRSTGQRVIFEVPEHRATVMVRNQINGAPLIEIE